MRPMFRIRCAIAALGITACLAVPAMALPAAAADDPAPSAGAAPADAPAADAPPADAGKKAAAHPAKADDKMADLLGANGDLYGNVDESVPVGGNLEWANRRSIRVVQKRGFIKESRHGFSLLGGAVPNDDFFVYPLVGAGYQYFFSEDIALDVHSVYSFYNESQLKGALTKERPDGPGLTVRLPQALRGYASAGADWYLLHGKLGFFSTHLTEFDLALTFGLGAVWTEITAEGGAITQQFRPAGEVGADLMFYLSDNFALKMGYRQNFYPSFIRGVSYPISATMAVSYFTDALK